MGNGHSINARRDAWIPTLAEGKIKCNISFDSNTLLKDLFKADGDWDVSKPYTLFLPFEVQAMQRVPIGGPNVPDTRFWRFENNGSYSVKSGYWNSNCSPYSCDEPSCSTKDQFWNIIWNLQIPPKFKIFIWKMALDIITSEANLVRQHVPGDPRCLLCGYYCANTTHVVFFCQVSRQGWKNSG